MKILLLLLISVKAFSTTSLDIRKNISPRLVGDTLYIQGNIDSHIYDYLAYETRPFKTVSLYSYGGNHNWALEIGRKLQELRVNTVIEDGAFCASACVYLFGSGSERIMHEGAWIGIHGARLHGGYVVEFSNNCVDFISASEGVFNKSKVGCSDFLSRWYETSLEATEKAFTLIEKAGVSTTLKNYYFSLEDDPHWYSELNVLKKRDLVLDANTALKFNLTTSVQTI
ncbi:MAG: hypothetical protein ACRBBP_11680 [Bdellovibrionales bacterium]